MIKLPKFTLESNDKKENWSLKNSDGRTIKLFNTRKEATSAGILEKAAGSKGGSVKIQKLNGKFQEERTFHGSEDPKSPRANSNKYSKTNISS